MISRRILAAVALLCAIAAPAYAQKTAAQLNAEIGVSFPNNTQGQITPLNLRNVTNDIVNSIMPTAPVTANNLACFNGTTGLLKDCGVSLLTSWGNVGVSIVTGGTNKGLLYDNAGVLGNTTGIFVTNTQLGIGVTPTVQIDIETPGATGTSTAQLATVSKFFDGSVGSPHTAITPSFSFSRYDAMSSNTLTGNSPTIFCEVVANGSGSGNPNSACHVAFATQNGTGDIVGYSTTTSLALGSTAGHTAYGYFAGVTANVATSRAFGAELEPQNATGSDVGYTNLSPYPAFVGVHVAAGGANLNTVAFWGSISGSAPFDCGVCFTTGAVKTVGFEDDTSSVTVLKATGTHINGIDLSSATLTTAYKSTGFSIDGSGNSTALSSTVVNPAGAVFTATGGTADAHSGFMSVGNSGMTIGPTTSDGTTFITNNVGRGTISASAADWSFGSSGAQGTLSLFGSSSGSSKIVPPASGGGSLTLPAGTDTLMALATTQSPTNKTISGSTNILGGVTMTLGSDATGDMYYRNVSGILTRLPVCTGTNVVGASAGVPACVAQSGSGSGTVTSVGFTGGLISVATPTSTPAFTVAGTSGGIPYFSSASAWASSSLLVANAIMVGGGSGAAPSTITTGTGLVTAIGNNLSAAGGLTTTIASGTSVLGTGAIGSGACATVVTTSATNAAATDVVAADFNSDPTAVTGYVPSTSGMLTIISYPTANNVNFKVCNNTGASITPGAVTLNWRVTR